MKAGNYKISEIVVSVLQEEYQFLNFKILKDSPIVISIEDLENLELMKEIGEDEITNYELLENLVTSIIDTVRETFDLECDYEIGTENVIEIVVF